MIYSCTDWYIVDEDLTAISVHGGGWSEREWAGIALRFVFNSFTDTLDGVASIQKINRTYSLF